jgi:small-conductance mechanosensitive channel
MKRGTALLVYFTMLIAVVLLLTACRSDSDLETATPTSGVTPTPASEAESTSSTDEAVSSTESEASDDQLIATPTLPPTPTPGPVDNLVANLVEDSAVEDLSFLGLTSEDWINLVISLLVVLAGYVVAGWLIGVALRWLVQRSDIEVADVILKKFSGQLRWLVVILLAAFATFRLVFLSEAAIRLFRAMYFSIFLWTVFYVLWELIDYAVQLYEEQIESQHGDTKYESMLPLVKKVTRFMLLMVAVIVWLDSFGVNVTALIAALGIAGLALSLAAQDTLSDAIAGLVILTDQPFRVGDRIEIEEIGTWGDVVEIGTRTTKIRTRDNRMVIVPNSTIGNNQVINYTFPDPRYRVQIDIGIGYGTDIDMVQQLIIDTVREIDGVLPDKPVDAIYNEIGDSTMIFRVRWWIESYTEKRHMYGLVNTALQEALDAAGVDMPFPTHTTNLEIGEETAERLSRTLPDSEGG